MKERLLCAVVVNRARARVANARKRRKQQYLAIFLINIVSVGLIESEERGIRLAFFYKQEAKNSEVYVTTNKKLKKKSFGVG